VIKIDVEGHEIPVLRSAKAVLTEHPAVAVEVLSTNVDATQDVTAPGYEVREMPSDYAVATYIHRIAHEPAPLVPTDGRDQIALVFT
jgi:methyltransferase FkbM-like protein